eukprot:GFKZ01012823.1.p3 GENE.GFKZ01012823.1~~GFKZ01012823.1.p3  ORF type:complete len:102 (+),score=4.62 GFKZ01012823.1:2466-2771(+)
MSSQNSFRSHRCNPSHQIGTVDLTCPKTSANVMCRQESSIPPRMEMYLPYITVNRPSSSLLRSEDVLLKAPARLLFRAIMNLIPSPVTKASQINIQNFSDQ